MLRAGDLLTGSATGERRLVAVVASVVFADTVFYAAIAPLLPTLAHELSLSKRSAGILTASYPAGTLLGALPGGILAVRIGAKRTVYVGLALFGASTLAFGLLSDVTALDTARLIEGVGGACSWAGGLAWIVDAAPEGRRGAVMGTALGAAIAGALFGPVVGTIADAVGRPATFGAVVAVVVVLVDQARRLPHVHRPSDQGLSHLRRALRRGGIRWGMWLVALPAVASGAINVLGPLRLHRLGFAATAVGATFVIAAGLEAVVSPLVGGLSDRVGRLLPMRVGLLAAIGTLSCFTLVPGALGLAAIVVAGACVLGAFWAPAMALLSEAAGAEGLEQALAAALINLAWAAGQILGAGAGGALAKAGGDALPMISTAGLCGLTLLALRPRAYGSPA